MQKNSADVITFGDESTYCLHFNASKPPFDDIRLRLALSLVIDVVDYVGRLDEASRRPAFGGFVPPGVPCHIADSGMRKNIDLARQLLSEAGFPEGKGFPSLEIVVSDGRINEGALLREYWNETLNIDIKLVSLPFPEFLERTHDGSFVLSFAGWSADYPDPDSFLFGSPWLEQSGWENKEYLDLVQKARFTIDQTERKKHYRKAQELITKEVPLMPLFYNLIRYFVKANVQNFWIAPRTTLPVFQDLILGPDKDG